MYKIKFSKDAKKFIEKQDSKTKKRFKKVFEKLAINPYPSNNSLDAKKLKNIEGYRLRIGKYRFIYIVLEDSLIIVVNKGDSRGDIYK